MPTLDEAITSLDTAQFDDILSKVDDFDLSGVDLDKAIEGLDVNSFQTSTDEVLDALPVGDIPDVAWYNKPIIDLPSLIGMKPPSEVTTEDFAQMRKMAGVPDDNMFANLPINPQGPGSMANIQMAQAYRTADDDQMRMMYGAFYGAMESAAGLTTPTNLALLGVGGALGKGTQLAYKGGRLALASGLSVSQAVMSGVFAAQMGKELPKQWAGVKEAIDMAQDDPSMWGDVGRGLANMVTTGVFTLGAIKGVKHGLETGRAINTERVINIENGKIQAKQQLYEQQAQPGRTLATDHTEIVTQDKIDKIEAFNNVPKEQKRVNRKAIIAGEEVTPTDQLLNDVAAMPERLPATETKDYVYNADKAKYELKEVHMDPKLFPEFNKAKKTVVGNSGYNQTEFHEMIREITGTAGRRMTKEGIQLLNDRAKLITPDMTKTEVRDLLATGMNSQPHFDSEVSMGDYTKREDFRSHWTRSGFTTIEGMGRFGELLRDQAMQYEYAWTSLRDQYKLGVQNAIKALPKDKVARHNFMKAVAEANETGVWNDRLSPHREIYEQLETTALRPIKDLAIEMGMEIQDPVTGKKIPFADAVENKKFYFPHKFDRTFAKKFKANYDKMFDKLRKDYGKTDVEAKRILNDIYEQRLGGIREGNIEYARVFDVPGWLGDPNAPGFKFNDAVAGLNRYIEGSVRKLMDLRYFEGRGQGEFVLRDQINVIRDPDLRQYVTDMTNQFRGIGDYGKDPQGILHTLRNVQIMRKMNMSAIQNSMQFLIGTLPKYSRLGWRKMVADMGRAFWDIGVERWHGITLDDMASGVGEAIQETYDIVGNSWSSKAASKTLKMNMQSKTEVGQRVFAERMGRKYIKEMVSGLNGRSTPKVNEMLADPIQRKQVIAEMKKYGVSEATINDGVFRNKQISKNHSVNELDYSAHLFSRFTQFRSTALDLPLGWQGSAAKTVLQFKNFSHNQGRMVMNDIVKPFMKNPTMANARPLLTWLAGSFISNAATLMIRNTIYDMIAGDAAKRDRDTMTAAMEDIISVSPLWFVYSIYLTALYGKTQFGATAQDVDDTLRSIARGQPEKLLKTVLPTPLNKIGGK